MKPIVRQRWLQNMFYTENHAVAAASECFIYPYTLYNLLHILTQRTLHCWWS